MDSIPFLPYGRQCVDDDDIAAVAESLRSDFLTTGPLVRRYEDAFAASVNAMYAVSCSSGTAGLHLAALASGLGPGDLAIVPAVTFLATANAIRYVGADVVFADVDPESGLLTTDTLAEALDLASRRTGTPRALLPVHLKGVPVDMVAISAMAREAGLVVIEDAAHALGAVYGDGAFKVGANCHSDFAVFSTHPVKAMTTGEGGMITTRNPELAEKLRRFRSHGMQSDPNRWQRSDLGLEDGLPVPWYYEMQAIGLNYRLPDINCALGLSQIAKLGHFLARRAELVALYDRLLSPLIPLVRPPKRSSDGQPGWHLYAVQIDFAAAGLGRRGLMQKLRDDGIGTQVHYIPVSWQPYYRQLYGDSDLPGASRFYRGTLSLPLYPTLRDQDVERVVDRLKWHLGGAGRSSPDRRSTKD